MRSVGKELELSALLIAPNRQLAQALLQTLPETRAFQIVADLKAYPPPAAMDTRLKQLKPDVVLVDVSADTATACDLISTIMALPGSPVVVALHTDNDPQVLVQVLRSGATEFLSAPFDPQSQREAITRLRRLRQPDELPPERGRLVAFSSAKPGSGASTMAAQTAFSLRKLTNQRVLLADFDLMGGTIAFYLKLNTRYSLMDALHLADRLDPATWSTLTANYRGIDILAAPEEPHAAFVEQADLHRVLEYMRLLYDWVVIDLPSVFHQISLMTLAEADQGLLVTTAELPSLHLATKATRLLQTIGMEKDRYRVLINRLDRRDNIIPGDLEKLFNCPVQATFPNDYFALHRVVTLGQPLAADCELGKNIEALAGQLCGPATAERGGVTDFLQAKPLLSQT